MSIDEAVQAIRKLYLEEDSLPQEEIDMEVWRILVVLVEGYGGGVSR